MSNIFIQLFVAHMIADYPLQTDWMAINKKNPKNISGYIHGIIHGILAGLLTGSIHIGLWTAFTHWVIDLRFIVNWIAKIKGMNVNNPLYNMVMLLTDQTLHVMIMFVLANIYG